MNRASSALSALVMLVAQIAPASASPVPVEATLNWSGYALAGSAFTGVTGTFNVPAPLESAPCGAETLVWVGVDGLDNHDLLQAGVAESTFVVPSSPSPPEASAGAFLCTGQVQVFAWWEDLPSEQVRVDLPVKVGDKVGVSIFKMSPGWWALAVHDLTAKRSFLLAQPYAGPQTSVEWVVEAPLVMGLVTDPVPFSTVDFRDLGAQGELRDLVRVSFGSKGHFASRPGAVASTTQLMRTGFAVHWAGR